MHDAISVPDARALASKTSFVDPKRPPQRLISESSPQRQCKLIEISQKDRPSTGEIAVVHCELGPFARRRHQVRCIAEQCHTGYATPSALDRKRIDRARHRIRLTVGDERCQLRSPAIEFLGDAGQASRRIGEVDAGNSALRLLQRHVRVQRAIELAVPGVSANSEPPPTASALAL
jgi:hypothetical protein